MEAEDSDSQYGSFSVEVSHYSFERLIGKTYDEAMEYVMMSGVNGGEDATDRTRRTIDAILTNADRQACPPELKQKLVEITSQENNTVVYEELGGVFQRHFGSYSMPLFDEEVYDHIAQERPSASEHRSAS